MGTLFKAASILRLRVKGIERRALSKSPMPSPYDLCKVVYAEIGKVGL
jgi:hypothetical protein